MALLNPDTSAADRFSVSRIMLNVGKVIFESMVHHVTDSYKQGLKMNLQTQLHFGQSGLYSEVLTNWAMAIHLT